MPKERRIRKLKAVVEKCKTAKECAELYDIRKVSWGYWAREFKANPDDEYAEAMMLQRGVELEEIRAKYEELLKNPPPAAVATAPATAAKPARLRVAKERGPRVSKERKVLLKKVEEVCAAWEPQPLSWD
jgi:hypothetical protein